MSDNDEIDVEKETVRTLQDIHDVTVKIKQELNAINGLILENGDLSIAAKSANRILTRIALEKGFESIDELLNVDDDDQDLLNRVTVDTITQKIMSIMNT